VQYVGVSQDLSTILVTSPNAEEGKSTTAANLAVALAQAGNKIILIDTDMRRPSLHHKFNVPNNMGLTNLLLSKEDDTAFTQETDIPGLSLITSGPLPPNPAELIYSERMKHIINWLREKVDYIILDSPPVLAVTDAVLLSQLASTTLMVVEADKTRQQTLLLAIRQIEAVDGHIAGILLNKINPRRSSYYYNYYYKSHYHYHENGSPGGKSKQKLGVGLSGFLTFLLSWLHTSS
jgi:capsular exopolysaccharide synthesis family protein